MILTIVLSILIFEALIFIHEFGHFIVAKCFDVQVNEFAIGMGPKIASIKKGNTVYSIRSIPFGGYVKLEGEDKLSDSEYSFNRKTTYQRAAVIAAGAFMNLLLGFILMFVLVVSQPKLCNMTIENFKKGSISNLSGLKVGDTILKIDSHKINTIRDFEIAFLRMQNGTADFTVRREGRSILIPDVKLPIKSDEETGIKYSDNDFLMGTKDKTISSIIVYSYNSTISLIKMTWFGLVDLVNGNIDINALSGPVQVTVAIGKASTYGWKTLLMFTSIITINLGVVNLLPIPALDGGRLMFLLIEAIRRKRIKPEYEAYIHLAGFALMMLLAILVTCNDIIKLFKLD